ncbi:hypothetical protein GW17_00047835 [Ensete ventricosum]|nr:hypothetical protein GW17_00047835 [Ensete ventricosum]RZS14864.1 hypothetical protein BHM03_00046618 [Ensete ventricosum]
MALATAAITAALSSLSLRPPGLCLKPLRATLLPSSSSVRARTLPKLAATADIDTTFFDNVDPNDDIPFDPPAPPEGYVAPTSFDELPPESEGEVAAGYEEIYGPAYSGVSVLGNDIYVMDGKVKKASGLIGRKKRDRPNDGFEERVVQVRRVTKVVKGGKKLSFRAIVVVGDKKGQVGVGVGKAKEVVDAIAKSAINARRNIVSVDDACGSTMWGGGGSRPNSVKQRKLRIRQRHSQFGGEGSASHCRVSDSLHLVEREGWGECCD